MTRKNMPTCTVLSLSALAPLITSGLLYAGPLDPPAGPVTSTYKTLSEVEPRTAINVANTPGDADSLFKITQRGSYYLTGNITGVINKHGIEIVASGVTLDLNGFDLVGVPAMGAFDGVSVTVTNLTNIAVVNGSVRNWGDEGVDLGSNLAINCRVEDLLSRGNAGTGISISHRSTVTNCSAYQNTAHGISTGVGCTVTNCSASDNTAHGISTSIGCTVTNCSASSNTLHGINTGIGCTVTNCSAYFNAGNGITVGEGCTVTDCAARDNLSHGIDIGSDCTLIGCTVTSNQAMGIDAGVRCTILKSTVSATSAGPGVRTIFEGLRIEGSSINLNSTFGVVVDTASDIAELAVVNCTIRANGSAGISSEASTQVLDSIISGNGTTGIILSSSGFVRGCTITSNISSGVELLSNANVVANNTLSSNATTIATAAGILVQGTDNTIDGNRLFSNNQGGVKVNLAGNLVLRNYLARAGATITAVAGNSVAQVISPGAGFISTDPNANFTY